jgi:hypothetical protein
MQDLLSLGANPHPRLEGHHGGRRPESIQVFTSLGEELTGARGAVSRPTSDVPQMTMPQHVRVKTYPAAQARGLSSPCRMVMQRSTM